MTSDAPRPRHGSAIERVPRPKLRRAFRHDPRHLWNLHLQSVATRIPVATIAQSPTLLVVTVEDLCWQSAVDWNRAHRPHRWHRAAYRAWAQQSQRLDDKRERLRELAKDELLHR